MVPKAKKLSDRVKALEEKVEKIIKLLHEREGIAI